MLVLLAAVGLLLLAAPVHGLRRADAAVSNATSATRVQALPGLAAGGMKSAHYAGHVEVDTTNNGRLFYWLVEAEVKDPTTAPLTIWLNGGPGCTSMLGLFMECGPFHIEADLTLSRNEYGWQKTSNVLFVDQPVGTGLSTLGTRAYPSSGAAVAAHFYTFLLGFLQQHPEYVHGLVSRPIYFFGESHAGRWIPQFYSHIATENARNTHGLQIQIHGAGIGNGWVHPLIQYDYSGFAHGLGLISLGQMRTLQTKFTVCTDAIARGVYHDAACFANLDSIMDSVRGNVPLNFYDVRAYGSSNEYPPAKERISAYLDQPEVRKALHVESNTQPFEQCNYDVYGALGHEDAVSTLHDVDAMLRDGVDVLFFNGQWDMMCNAFNTERVLYELQWPGRDDFKAAERYTWRVKGHDVPAGFVQTGGNLTFAIVSGAGHMVPYDVPLAALDLFTRFVQRVPFTDTRQEISVPTYWNATAEAACDLGVRASETSTMWHALVLLAALSSGLVATLLTLFYMRSGRRRRPPAILVEVDDEDDEDDGRHVTEDDLESDWDDAMVEMEELTKESRQRKTTSSDK
ncbi:hypothetical protein SPRG_00614 [Saprolegnia parasitica CBS 223.65]|uniref:Carboxypeptidase D n=1 Tax=Saprolegnia parasitica (strain CBS 223.65) TaxID=695850 RepID=A0A067D795_SAPPC|nr:hypothetical protein SPRG_00614 [Saprolegnia parasitica CBS 223.65]KDO34551.1 hypothetical protein SPRG_00614 [Saprolegnia parasitica CBS 223.65]|eukprot:XP_012194229.1 hypothetical protein SPRG_00614 [Saprolegnia parasitica CBS 223.65]